MVLKESPMTAAPLESDLRKRIIDASVILMTEKGLADFSLREVARRAGVSHQAPYHYFPDREAILAAVCEQGFDLLAEMVGTAQECETVGERFERSVLAYVDFACTHQAHFRIMFRPDIVHLHQHDSAENSADRAFNYLPAMITECIRAGLTEGPPRDALITAVWSQMHGLACLLLDGPLAMKVPRAAEDRAALVRDTARVFRSFLDAAVSQGAKETEAPPSRARAKSAGAKTPAAPVKGKTAKESPVAPAKGKKTAKKR
jgi:AcrR family transcriptional regulator